MAVDEADVVKLKQTLAEAYDADLGEHLRALQTLPELIGYAVACARQDGDDEADMAELLVRVADVSREDLRDAISVLRPLGYAAVCARLREVARRAPKRKPCTNRFGGRLAPAHREAMLRIN
jgi:hypothetical protein